MTTYTISINGTTKGRTRFSYDKYHGSQAWTFSITLPDYDSTDTDIAIGNTVLIKRDNVTVFKGEITTIEPQYNEDGNPVIVSGRSNHGNLMRLVVGQGDVDGAPHTLISNELSGSGISAGTLDTWPGQYSKTTVDIAKNYQDKWSYISEIAKRIGWEVIVRPDDTCDFQENIGTDRTGTIQLKTGVESGGGNCRTISKTVDASQLANRVYAIGQGDSWDWLTGIDDGGNDYVEDSTSISTYGLHEVALQERGIDDDTTLKTRAYEYLQVYKNPVTTYNVEVLAHNYSGYYCEVGDLVNLVDTQTNTSGDYRIHSIHVDHERVETTTMELSNRPKGLPEYIEDEWDWLHDFDNPQIDTKTTGTTNNNGSTGVTNNTGSTGVTNNDNSTSTTNNDNADNDTATAAGGASSSGSSSDSNANQTSTNWPTITSPDSCGHWGNIGTQSSVGWMELKDTTGDSIRWLHQAHNTAAIISGFFFEPQSRSGNTCRLKLESTYTADLELQTRSYSRVISTHTHNITSPNHTHTHTDPQHTHTHTDPNHTHTHTDPNHTHTHTDPEHTH